MPSLTIETWKAQENAAFENFNDFIALRLEDAITRSIPECLKRKRADGKEAVLELPWGTYRAVTTNVGEGGGVQPVYEPSKGFLKLINDDANAGRDLGQETFDPDYVKLVRDYTAYGYFDPDKVKNAPARDRGMIIADDDFEYFLNGYMQVLATIARDKQRTGKTYRLEIGEQFSFGTFEFDYGKEDDISVKFIPHKTFKQYLKDDSVADGALIGGGEFVEAAAASVSIFTKKDKKAKKHAKLNPIRDDGNFYKLRRRAG